MKILKVKRLEKISITIAIISLLISISSILVGLNWLTKVANDIIEMDRSNSYASYKVKE